MAVITDIADAVVAKLEAATLSMTPTVSRVYVPVYRREDAPGLQVYVLGLTQVLEAGTRAEDVLTYTIKVAVYNEVDPADRTSVDAMVSFTEEVFDLYRSNTELAEYTDAALTDIKVDPVYDPAQLDTHHTFVSVVTINYTLYR